MQNLRTVFIKIMQDLGWVRGTFFACSIFVLPLSEALGLALLLTFVQSVFVETTTLFPALSDFIKNNFNLALVVLVLLFFLKLILEIGIRLFSIKIIDDSRKKMTVDIFHAIVEGSYSRNIAISSGEKIRNLNEVGTIFQSLIIPLFAISIEVITVIAIVGLALNFIGNDLIVSLAGIFVLLYLFSRVLKKYLQTWGKIRVENAAKINQNLIETFRAWEEIRANRFVSKLASKLASDLHQYLKVQRFAQTSFGSVKSSVEFLVIFFSAFFLWYKFGTGLDQSFIVDPASAVSALASISLLGLRLVQSGTRIIAESSSLNYGLAAVDVVAELLTEVTSVKEHHYVGVQADGRIELVSASFTVGGSVIGPIDVRVNKGELVLLKGRSGSGKSSLLKVIVGLIRLDKGSLRYGTYTTDTSESVSVHDMVYVPQETYIPPGSVREYFRFNDPHISDEDIKQFLKIVGLEDLNSSDPLSFILEDNNSGISGGQRQRLVLARYLAQRPTLLICDEISSGLDKKTEKEVFAKVRKEFPELTIILATHSSICDPIASKILTLD